MRLSMVLAAFWLGLSCLMPAHAVTAADALLAQANAALASGQYPEVKTLASTGLSEPALPDLTRSRLLMARGLAQQALGSADEALVDFTTALQTGALQGEERARAFFARGLSLDGQGRLDTAIGDYSAALRTAPRASYALNNRANVYRRQGRFTEAKRDYAAALAADTPNPQYPWYGLGQIAEIEGDPQAARGLYSRALAADPDFQLARERLQALGAASLEGDMPTDAGIVVLKPPTASKDASIVLRPPPSPGDAAPFALKPPSARAAVPPTPVAETRQPQPRRAATATPSMPPPGLGMPLRPAIAESVPATGPLVQLGAWRSEAEARTGWAAAQAMADGLLDGQQPVIVRADIPASGTFYRLRVPARGAAGAFCTVLEGKGLACLPVRD